MNAATRYRIEDGKACIDIKLRTTHQLFEGRDPSPFRERDLDEDAVEYILGALQELPVKADVKIVFLFEEKNPQIPAATVAEAVRAHFLYEIETINRRIREHLRHGYFTLLVGLAVLVVFLTLAELTILLSVTHVRQIVREGLVITGWVAMWRPLDVLLYEWWPLVRQRRRCTRVCKAEIAVGYARESHAPHPG